MYAFSVRLMFYSAAIIGTVHILAISKNIVTYHSSTSDLQCHISRTFTLKEVLGV